MTRTVKQLEARLAEHNQVSEALHKRTKELDCLYTVLEVVNYPGLPLGERLQQIVSSIPKGWQYSGIASARLVFNGQVYTSSKFEGGPYRQAADIVVDGKRLGTIEVCYAEERPERDEGPFLKEERKLIDAIARRISTFVKRRRAEKAREQAQAELQKALTKILGGFLPICANCKKIRDEGSEWVEIEAYIRDHTHAQFSHSICPACVKALYPDLTKTKDAEAS
jgi:GAF domain-containing protein